MPLNTLPTVPTQTINPFGGTTTPTTTSPFALPPPPPADQPDPYAARRPQPSLSAALRASFIRARSEWTPTWHGHRMHGPAAHSAAQAIAPFVPEWLLRPLSATIATLACPWPLRLAILLKRPFPCDMDE